MSRPKTTLPYNPVTQRMRAMIGTVPAEPTQPAQEDQLPERVQPTQAAKPALVGRRSRSRSSCSLRSVMR